MIHSRPCLAKYQCGAQPRMLRSESRSQSVETELSPRYPALPTTALQRQKGQTPFLLVKTKGELRQKGNRGLFSYSFDQHIFTEGLLCAGTSTETQLGTKGQAVHGEVGVLWEQRRAQPAWRAQRGRGGKAAEGSQADRTDSRAGVGSSGPVPGDRDWTRALQR